MKAKYFALVIALLVAIIVFPFASAQEITKEDVLAETVLAKACIQAMEENGLAVTKVNDLLILAGQIIERADLAESLEAGLAGPAAEIAKKTLEGLPASEKTYSGAMETAKEVCAIKENTIGMLDKLTVFESNLKEKYFIEETSEGLGSLIAGELFSSDAKKQLVDTSEAEALLEQAKDFFAKERYGEAEALLEQAKTNLDEKEAEITALNVIGAAGSGFFEKYWPETLIAVLLLAAGLWILWKRIRIRRIREKLGKLRVEQKSLVKLMKKTQEDRYKKAKLSRMLYRIRMDKYIIRLNETKQTIPVLEEMLKGRGAKKEGKKARENKTKGRTRKLFGIIFNMARKK